MSVRKVSNLNFFRKPGEFQLNARLHEPTLNFHKDAWISSHLSIAPVDGKHHLSEVMFSALVKFSLYTPSMHPMVKQSPKSTTGMSSIAYMMLCSARDQSCSQQAIGASITTISSTFLALDSDFFREKPVSLFCWCGSLWRLPVPAHWLDTFLTGHV